MFRANRYPGLGNLVNISNYTTFATCRLTLDGPPKRTNMYERISET
jgi:hypothetical protein